ncbi:MAG: hypothetical protein ABL959_19255, partial [Pyrinomonadaceae bacterium]
VRLLEPISGTDVDGKPTMFGFDPGDFLHPLLREFRGNPGAGLETALIQRYVKAASNGDATNNVETVINFTSGDPAILTVSNGTGRCVLITTSLDESWGEWAIWAPGFVPLVHELVQYAAAGRTQPREQLVGETILRKLHNSPGNIAVTLTRPNGDRQTLSAQDVEGMPTIVVGNMPTPGIYALSFIAESSHSERIAINVDPRESDPHRLDSKELSTSASLNGTIAIRDATSLAPIRHTENDTTRSSLARGLLLAALALLLIEQGLAWRFTFGMTVALIVVGFASMWLAISWQITLLIAGGVCAFTRLNPLSKMLGRMKPPLKG